jgi:hypothetical protein
MVMASDQSESDRTVAVLASRDHEADPEGAEKAVDHAPDLGPGLRLDHPTTKNENQASSPDPDRLPGPSQDPNRLSIIEPRVRKS